MADKSLPDSNLPPSAIQEEEGQSQAEQERRALLRRAAIGLPVILATVHGRTVWAATAAPSGAGSHG